MKACPLLTKSNVEPPAKETDYKARVANNVSRPTSDDTVVRMRSGLEAAFDDLSAAETIYISEEQRVRRNVTSLHCAENGRRRGGDLR